MMEAIWSGMIGGLQFTGRCPGGMERIIVEKSSMVSSA
jgi:hypothetical protein